MVSRLIAVTAAEVDGMEIPERARSILAAGETVAGPRAEAASRVGASTKEITKALGVTQFTRMAGSLCRSLTAPCELAVATGSGVGRDDAR